MWNRQKYSCFLLSCLAHASTIFFLLSLPLFGNNADKLFLSNIVFLTDDQETDPTPTPVERPANKTAFKNLRSKSFAANKESKEIPDQVLPPEDHDFNEPEQTSFMEFEEAGCEVIENLNHMSSENVLERTALETDKNIDGKSADMTSRDEKGDGDDESGKDLINTGERAEPEPNEIMPHLTKVNEAVTGIAASAVTLPDIFIAKDIRIEIYPLEAQWSDISVRFFVRPYPDSGHMLSDDKVEAVEFTDQTAEGARTDAGQSLIRTITVVNAARGFYMFIVENTGEKTRTYFVRFILNEKRENGRIKEYSAWSLPPHYPAVFRFLFPDLIFWDDDESFSGVIEDSQTITKFIYETGLVWKEKKDVKRYGGK